MRGGRGGIITTHTWKTNQDENIDKITQQVHPKICMPYVPRAGSPGYGLVPRAGSPGYSLVPRAASPG